MITRKPIGKGHNIKDNETHLQEIILDIVSTIIVSFHEAHKTI